MKLHPRHDPVTRAGIDISEALIEVAKKYELTTAELVNLLATQIQQWTKMAIREERAEP